MTQSPEEKRAALVTVLPLLHSHLGLICSLKSGLGQLTETPPDGYRPPIVVCSYDCYLCPSLPTGDGCPPDESWVRTERYLRTRYRLYAVARSLDALRDHRKVLAHAVYWEHIEPWDAWNPHRRPAWAAEGVAWMAAEIPGELVGYGAADAKRTPPIRSEVVRLRGLGLSYRRIALRLGTSKDTVGRLLRAAQERTGCP